MGIKRTMKRSTKSSIPTIGEAFQEFYTEKEGNNLAPSTLRNYGQSWGYFKEFHSISDDDEFDSLNSGMVYEWINTLKEDGVSMSSINHYIRDVRTFLNWCMDKEYLAMFKIKEVKVQDEIPKMFPEEEIEKLLVKPTLKDSYTKWRNWAICNWVYSTGNRASSIVNVRIGDIDFKKGEIVLAHTKNKKAQVIPLSSATALAIKEFMRLFHADSAPDTYLFCNIGGEKLTTNALQSSFAKYCKERGATHTNIHGLRHNFAKAWIMNGGSPSKLQKILGHATLAMTQKYVKLFSQDLKEGFDDFNPLDTARKKYRRTNVMKRS